MPKPDTTSQELRKNLVNLVHAIIRQNAFNMSNDEAIKELTEAIDIYASQREVVAEIKGKLLALDKMVMGAGEYHDDPYEYVVPLRHIRQYRSELNKFGLSQPIFRDKTQESEAQDV